MLPQKKYDCTIAHCRKINLSGPFGDFLFYVTLTTSYLWAWTGETLSIPNNFMQPLIKQIESFSGILIAYFNCKNILFYNIVVSYQDASSRFHLLGENACGGEILMSESRVRWRSGKLRRLNGRSHISSSSWYFGWPFTVGSTTWSCSTKSSVLSRCASRETPWSSGFTAV